MSDSKPTWENLVSTAAEMEWPDRTPAAVVACSFRVDRVERMVHLLFELESVLSEDEFDSLSEVEGGILSHLPDD